ncbi:hypothetical protein [Brucella melitensis]|uniref:hypothetical protein n=1 Tax=Brucella melitensis TaxID=29459 RepID=UPI0032BFEAB9
MITIQAAIDMASEEGFTITNDYKIATRGCQPNKRAFTVRNKKTGIKSIVTQVHAGSKTWFLGEARGSRAQMIIESMRAIKEELNEPWKS